MNDTATPPPSTPALQEVPGVRLDEALARFAGNEQRLCHWLQDFCDYGPQASQQIRAAIESGAREQAISLTHALKGRSAMLGMSELHSIALSLELTLKNGEPTALWIDELECTAQEMSQRITTALGKAPAHDAPT